MYKLTINGAGILKFEDGEYRTFIPISHPKYQEYLEWAKSNTPEPADVVTVLRTCEPMVFINRFTSTELGLARRADNDDVYKFTLLITAAKEYINLDDSNLITGMNALVSLGILTEARKTEILS